MRKKDVQMHYEQGRGYYPAINVKVYHLGCTTQDVVDKFGCSEEQAEKALEFAFESAQAGFWEYWGDDKGECENGLSGSPEYAYFPGHTVSAYSSGRSAGWLVLDGLPELESWDAVMLARWAKFRKAVLSDVKYQVGKESLLDSIENNQWWKVRSSAFNFVDGKDGPLCMADVRNDLAEYSREKYGFVPRTL